MRNRRFNNKSAQERIDTDILYSMLSYNRNVKRGYLEYLEKKNLTREELENGNY